MLLVLLSLIKWSNTSTTTTTTIAHHRSASEMPTCKSVPANSSIVRLSGFARAKWRSGRLPLLLPPTTKSQIEMSSPRHLTEDLGDAVAQRTGSTLTESVKTSDWMDNQVSDRGQGSHIHRRGYSVSAVRLSVLRKRLETMSRAELIKALEDENNDNLVESMDSASNIIALVSYRQERRRTLPGAASGVFDRFSLDGRALDGIIEAAERLGAEALWLDVWCHRERELESDDPDEFFRSLANVIQAVSAVVWLPRTKQTSPGEYGYRLWCTFEAVSIRHRGLPVAIAGIGMSWFQHVVLRLGSYVPGLWGDSTISDLAFINLSAYVSLLGFGLWVWFICAPYPEECGNPWTAVGQLMVILIVWATARRLLSQQVRLGKNAKMVMSIMCSHTASRKIRHLNQAGKAGQEQAMGNAKCAAQSRLLLHYLPWLPAYDRRDVLLVHKLLAVMKLVPSPSARTFQVLALSAYVAAWQSQLSRPKSELAGDHVVVGANAPLSLRKWVSARNIHITERSLSFRSSFRSYEGSRSTGQSLGQSGHSPIDGWSERAAGGVSGGDALAWASECTWLDGENCMKHSHVASPLQCCLKLDYLRKEGWTVIPNASCAFLTPLGTIYVAPPTRRAPGQPQRWTLTDVEHFPMWRPSLIRSCGGLLIAMGVNAAGWAVDYWLLEYFGSHNATTAANANATAAANATTAANADVAITNIGINVVLFLLETHRCIWSLAIFLLFAHTDLKVALAGRFPIPMPVFNHPLVNFTVALVPLPLALAYFVVQGTVDLKDVLHPPPEERGGVVRAMADATGMAANLVMAVGLLYKLGLSWSFIIWGSMRGWAHNAVLE